MADVHIASDALIATVKTSQRQCRVPKRELSRVGRLHQKGDTHRPRSMGHDKDIQKQAIRA